MNYQSTANTADRSEPTEAGLTLDAFTTIFQEIDQQPAWRSKADREMEYVDGNQLDSEILRKQREIGMPPSIEPLIGPAIDTVTGFEAKTRTDWRVTPDGDKSGDEVATALNYKLNQAERKAGADQACSNAYRSQVSVGIGWVEVSRNTNPFKFPYRALAVHRNEIWWDMLSVEPDLSDARYLVRRRWTDKRQVELLYPEHAELVKRCASGWFEYAPTNLDGGSATDLAMAWNQERGWSIEEQQWRDISSKRVCLFEVWYRVWVRVTVLRAPDGRIVEYDKKNSMHTVAIASGAAVPEKVVIAKMRKAVWLGPHKLEDVASPYRHDKFPYVPFWGKKEDRTGVPYGLVRGMMYMQDNVNASISKIRWGLSARRTVRTKGAVAMTDAKFRAMIARPDADVILDPQVMAQQNAVFKVEKDFDLSQQQYQMLQDARAAIQRVSGITAGFQGQQGTARSGVQEATQVEQSVQALADINDNFKDARSQVGDILLALIVEDMIGKRETVVVDGGALKEDRVIELNVPSVDEATGAPYLTNDVERTLLQVALNDVPSTPSFRAQQLAAMSEAFKAMPQKFQEAVLPHLLSLMDVPDREEVIRVIKDAAQHMSAEEIDTKVAEAVQQALKDAGNELKARELELKYSPEKLAAEIQNIVADTVVKGVTAAFQSMQAGAQVAQMPMIAPVADSIMQSAGYQSPRPMGDDPNFPVATQTAAMNIKSPYIQGAEAAAAAPVHENTSPGSPPVPPRPASPSTGIETMRTSDNQPAGAPV